MPDTWLSVAALACAVLGMGRLALAMDVHWRQVRDRARSPRAAPILRWSGWTALLVSLVLCLAADTATMAVLVWMMLLALSAATIAFVLAVKPRLLAPLTIGA